MILRVSIKTSMTYVLCFIKSVAKLIMSNSCFNTITLINSSLEFLRIIFEIVSFCTNITLRKWCSLTESTIFYSLTTSHHFEEGISQRSIARFAFQTNRSGIKIVEIFIGIIFWRMKKIQGVIRIKSSNSTIIRE